MKTRDGVTLYADVYRPAGEGPFYVLLVRTPYNKDNFATFGPKAVKHGFMVADGAGSARPLSGPRASGLPFKHETDDGYDAVDRAALPHSNGKVGMFRSWLSDPDAPPSATRPTSPASAPSSLPPQTTTRTGPTRAVHLSSGSTSPGPAACAERHRLLASTAQARFPMPPTTPSLAIPSCPSPPIPALQSRRAQSRTPP